MKDGQPYQNSFTIVDVDCPSTSHTDSPDRKVGAVSFRGGDEIGSRHGLRSLSAPWLSETGNMQVRVLPSTLPIKQNALTGLRNNVWNYVAEKRSREDLRLGIKQGVAGDEHHRPHFFEDFISCMMIGGGCANQGWFRVRPLFYFRGHG